MNQQIILRNIEKPKEADVEKDIDWLIDSLGFTTGRDIECASSQIIHRLLKEISEEGHASTGDIAEALNIAVQRVNYHLRSIINSGFIYRERKLIFLREGS